MTGQTTHAANISMLLEAERNGTLDPKKAALLGEARKRGLLQTFEIQGPDGRSYEVEATDMAAAVNRFSSIDTSTGSESLPKETGRQEMAALPNQSHATEKVNQPDEYRRLMDAAKEAHSKGNLELAKSLAKQAVQVRNQQAALLEQAKQERARRSKGLGTRIWENIVGDDDPTTQNFGEKVGTAINKGIESATGELVGDEFNAAVETGMGLWGDYGANRDFYRNQEAMLERDNPGVALTSDIVGALLGPGKGGASFINVAKGTAGRIGRGALVGGGTGAVYGFGEGEGGLESRARDSLSTAALGGVGGGAMVGLGQGLNRALNRLKIRGSDDAVPTLEGLRESAKGLYERARELGGELSGIEVDALAARASDTVRTSGFDKQLHPRVAAVMKRLSGESGPKSLQEMEILRRVARNAAESLQPDERRIASQIIDHIDEAVEEMGAGSPALKEARDTWSRIKRMELIGEAIEKASLQDNFAAGLRTQFKSLLRNPKTLRGFSEADKKLVRQVATGSTSVKALRGLSSLIDPKSLTGMAVAGTTAFAGPGLLPAMGIAGAGLATRSIADALTRGSAQRASNQVGRSPQTQAIIEALLKRPNPMARAAAASGSLGSILYGGPQ